MALVRESAFQAICQELAVSVRCGRSRDTLKSSSCHRQSGYTLAEMLIVVALLGVIAAVAMPAFQSNDDAALELAAVEVASAIRFAHSEAIRTGVAHGVHASNTDQRIRVYRLPSASPIYDVRDPLTKQIYDLHFGNGDSDIRLDDAYFKFAGVSQPREYLGFSAGTGLPKYKEFTTVRMLETAYVRLEQNGLTRTVDVSPMTGRVTVQ